MMEEYRTIMKNDVWEVVIRPKEKSTVISKWIYKINNAAYGSIKKYKARFLERGFTQKEGVDYEETFAPIARYTSMRTIISLASVMGWKLLLTSLWSPNDLPHIILHDGLILLHHGISPYCMTSCLLITGRFRINDVAHSCNIS